LSDLLRLRPKEEEEDGSFSDNDSTKAELELVGVEFGFEASTKVFFNQEDPVEVEMEAEEGVIG